MISEMMKSSIPSSSLSTRELRLAGGGPWWSSWAIAAASMASLGRGCRRLGLDVLDGLARRLAHALDQIRAKPPRARRGQRRDHDVVDAEELQRVHRRVEGIRITDHPGDEQ